MRLLSQKLPLPLWERWFLHILTVLILFFFLAPASASSSSTTSGNPIAPYYTPQYLFDQSGPESTPSFAGELVRRGYPQDDVHPTPSCWDIECGRPNLTPLEDLCEAEYYTRRRWMYTRAIIQESVNLLSVGALMIPLYFLGMYSNSTQLQSISALVLSTAFLYLIYNSTTLRSLIAAWLNPGNDLLVPFEREYARRKPELIFLDLDRLRDQSKFGAPIRIEQEFWTARQGIVNPRASMLFLQTLVTVPTQSKAIYFNDQALTPRLKLYDPKEASKIIKICGLHARGYRSQLGVNRTPPQFMTLIGAPGIGKSTLVDAIGESMDLPIGRLDLTAATPDKLIGTKDDPGILLTTLCQLKVRNGILFIDEFCHIAKNEELLATLLTILDPSRKKFYSPYLDLTIDISHLFIIIAGNEELTQAALKDRFTEHKTIHLAIHDQQEYHRIIETQAGSQVTRRLKSQSFRDDLANIEMNGTH